MKDFCMHNHPNVVLWTDNPGPYLDAIANAGLADGVAVSAIGRREALFDRQLEETNVLMAAAVPPNLLSRMPQLRWAQSMTAGVDGWLALPDLPEALVL